MNGISRKETTSISKRLALGMKIAFKVLVEGYSFDLSLMCTIFPVSVSPAVFLLCNHSSLVCNFHSSLHVINDSHCAHSFFYYCVSSLIPGIYVKENYVSMSKGSSGKFFRIKFRTTTPTLYGLSFKQKVVIFGYVEYKCWTRFSAINYYIFLRPTSLPLPPPNSTQNSSHYISPMTSEESSHHITQCHD